MIASKLCLDFSCKRKMFRFLYFDPSKVL